MRKFHAARGFTLVEIMIVVGIFGIVVAIAVPGFIRARSQSRMKSCQENLVKIYDAVEQWALENNKSPWDTINYPDDLVTPNGLPQGDGYLQTEPHCPAADGQPYLVTTVGTVPVCPVAQEEPGHLIGAVGQNIRVN